MVNIRRDSLHCRLGRDVVIGGVGRGWAVSRCVLLITGGNNMREIT